MAVGIGVVITFRKGFDTSIVVIGAPQPTLEFIFTKRILQDSVKLKLYWSD